MGVWRPTSRDFLADGDPAFGQPSPRLRKALPPPQEPADQPAVMDIISRLVKEGGVSKYLNNGVGPATMHEPETELMRLAETVFVAHLLNQAANEEPGSLERLLLVTAFNIAQGADVYERLQFMSVRPATCETFEYVHLGTGCKVLVELTQEGSEKIPRLSSWKVWGRGWGLEGESGPTQKMSLASGPGIDYHAQTRNEIFFQDGDRYQCDVPGGVITGLAGNKQKFAFKGSALVTHDKSGFSTKVNLSEPSRLSRDPKRTVKGVVLKDDKQVEGICINGTWNSQLVAEWAASSTKRERRMVLWQKVEEDRSNNIFGFSRETMQLNCQDKSLLSILPPTDSRLRADLQLLEKGLFSQVEPVMKRILEEAEAKAATNGSGKMTPAWFKKAPQGSWLKFRYKGGYWEARQSKIGGNNSAWTTSTAR